MIKFDKNEFLKPQIYSTLDKYESRCNVVEEIIEEIKELQKQNQKYKEVINKAIEYIENNATSNYFDKEKNMFRREEDLLEILKVVEIMRLTEEVKVEEPFDGDGNNLQKQNQKYKEVINKAIEYIENNELYETEYDYDYEENSYLSGISDEIAKKDLLEILKEVNNG